jgi:tetratricopeptide (TPR) repeat protein
MKFIKEIGLSVLIILFVAVSLSHGQSAAKRHLIYGVDYAAQGKFKKATEEFEKISRVDVFAPSAADSLKVIEDATDKKIESKTVIHFFKGAAYVLKGQLDGAIFEYDKAIKINPNFAVGYRCRGSVYVRKRQYDKAFADFNRALEINPRIATAYFSRGNIYLLKSQYEQAITDYNKAIEINPIFVRAYDNRGTVYYRKRQYDKAISDCGKAI